jgi:hypothetical protein
MVLTILRTTGVVQLIEEEKAGEFRRTDENPEGTRSGGLDFNDGRLLSALAKRNQSRLS